MKLAVCQAARLLLFAPADRRWRRRSGSGSGSGGVRAVAAARAARRAALKPYRKFSHALWTGEPRHAVNLGKARSSSRQLLGPAGTAGRHGSTASPSVPVSRRPSVPRLVRIGQDLGRLGRGPGGCPTAPDSARQHHAGHSRASRVRLRLMVDMPTPALRRIMAAIRKRGQARSAKSKLSKLRGEPRIAPVVCFSWIVWWLRIGWG
jgi:hypothetical protein